MKQENRQSKMTERDSRKRVRWKTESEKYGKDKILKMRVWVEISLGNWHSNV